MGVTNIFYGILGLYWDWKIHRYRPREALVKVAAITVTTHKPFDESRTGELLEGKLHEQFLWGGLKRVGHLPRYRASPYPTAVFPGTEAGCAQCTGAGQSDPGTALQEMQRWYSPVPFSPVCAWKRAHN